MNTLILITGATGFLGGATAVDAIRRGLGHRLLFLVRGSDPQHGFARLIDNLKLLGADAAELQQLDANNVLFADLDALALVAHDPRLQQVAVVIHCAALATFAPHPGLESINVNGTLALAGLLQHSKTLQRFVYISTAMACGAHLFAKKDIPETAQLSMTQEDHLVPYTRSKAIGERLLRENFPDLPLIVVRPSIIVGHSTLGCTPSQSIFWVFQTWHTLGVLTADMNDRIDVVPVDWCAAAIMTLAMKENLTQKVFHLSAGGRSSQTFRQIGKAMAAAKLANVTTSEYEHIEVGDVELLLTRIRERIPHCNPRLLTRALKLYAEFASLNYVFSNNNVLDEGIPSPPRFTDYLALCVASTRDIPITRQMEWDFK